jgi:hypothetical protein
MKNFTTQIASADTGNGNTAAMLAGAKKSISLPSIRTRITSKTLGLGKGSELEFTSAEWRGDTYAVGDDALILNRQGIDRHMGVNRYGGEHHQFMTAYALARLGVETGAVDLTLLCPPALYNDLKKPMQDAYTAQPVEITLKGDKKPRQWTYENVSILPEGYAAALCFTLDTNGQTSALTRHLEGDILLVDTGSFTTNAFRLHNGQLNPADLPQSSIQNGGGDANIRRPLLEWVQSAGGDLTAATLDDIDRVLRLASVSGDYTLQFGGAELDLKPMLDHLCKQYSDWLANQLDSRYSSLQAINGVLIVGGNADYVTPHLQAWYGKVIEYRGWREFAGLHPSDLNAVGALRRAVARLAAKK